ncbi:MAG TPA: hypothetical protein VKT30_03535 [Caulobacteraceae bacterium]|nr:hypothetical protein [Caulobacteraceae bacterium]
MSTAALPQPRETRVFRPLTVLLLVLAGVFSASAFMVLSAYAPDLRGGDDGGPHALSTSAVGFAGLVRLLQADGVPVEINRDGPDKRDPRWSLLVLTPSPLVSSAADVMALAKARNASTLIVLPKWQTMPDPSHTGWVRSVGLWDGNLVAALLGKDLDAKLARRSDDAPTQLIAGPGWSLPAFAEGRIDQLQSLSASHETTVLQAKTGEPVAGQIVGTPIVVLADPDLLNTHGLADPATARSAVSLILSLRANDGPVVFDVSLDGYKHSPGLLKLAFEPPFLGATLCLAGAALLMGLHAAYRFGAPERTQRALALGKRALAETSAGLIRIARREPHMAGGYLELNRGEVAKALGAVRLSGADLDAYVDRLGERVGAGSLSQLAAQVPQVKDRDGLVRFARRLYQWRLEMTRERR